MDESMKIKRRRYNKIFNHITDTLYQYTKNKNIEISMVRSGVTINDTREIITIVGDPSITYASFVVETSTMKVISVNVAPIAFNQYFGAFELKDKQRITDYLKSFEGLELDLYTGGIDRE